MNKTRTLTKGHLNGIHNLRQGLTKLPLLHGNMQKETTTEKNIIHDFMRFGDSSKEHYLEPTYSKAPIIRTEHWAVLAVHSMYCRTGISTGTYNRNFRVLTYLVNF